MRNHSDTPVGLVVGDWLILAFVDGGGNANFDGLASEIIDVIYYLIEEYQKIFQYRFVGIFEMFWSQSIDVTGKIGLHAVNKRF